MAALEKANRRQIEDSEHLEESFWSGMAWAMTDSTAGVGANASPAPPVAGVEANTPPPPPPTASGETYMRTSIVPVYVAAPPVWLDATEERQHILEREACAMEAKRLMQVQRQIELDEEDEQRKLGEAAAQRAAAAQAPAANQQASALAAFQEAFPRRHRSTST